MEDLINRRTATAATSGASMSSREAKLHHVGIVVPEIEHVSTLMGLLGLEAAHTQYVPQYDAECIFTRGAGTVIEFVVPRGGILTRFNKGMGGLHHIAFEVDDLESRCAELRAKGVVLLEEKPVDAGSLLINFLPPSYTRGIIVELVQLKAV